MGKYGFRKGKEKEYSVWRGINTRCLNKNCEAFHRYGGRGIKICDRWVGRDGFENFYNDMGPRPDGCTIDRINNDGNYSPENCRWATPKKQGNNRSTNVILEFKGKKHSITEWADILGIRPGTLHERLRRGTSIEKALTMKKREFHPELAQKAKEAGLSVSIVKDRIRLGWDEEDIFTVPKQKNQQWRKYRK